jgi:hypothetical protein
MIKTKKITLVLSTTIFILSIILIYFFSNSNKKIATPITDTPIIKSKNQTHPKEVNGTSLSFTATENSTVYEFMNKLKNKDKINFTEKNYTGMGKFISEINGIKGNGVKNWIYYVNGVKAEVGVSNYKINKGDIISWKYE